MSRTQGDVAEMLVHRQIISAEQSEEAWEFQRSTGIAYTDALIKLGYASSEQVLRAAAELFNLAVVDLKDIYIPLSIIELVPESVARENVCLPLACGKGAVTVALGDPFDEDILLKLAFILGKEIHIVLAVREQIIEAINRHYGKSEAESVVSMLQEFNDTTIDFDEDVKLPPCPSSPMRSETASRDKRSRRGTAEPPKSSCPPSARMPGAVTRAKPRRRVDAAQEVERQATVRYYHRMNPQRMYPLLVVLSKQELAEIVQRGVGQARSESFQAALDVPVVIEPILPGCQCYPPREQVSVQKEEVSVTFWVVPHVLGKVMQARLVLRQKGKVLAEIPLQIKVVKQGLTLLLGALSFLLPFGLMGLKHFGLDFESQVNDGFSLYARALQWCLAVLSPEILAGFLLLATVTAYFWFRPRKRDVFWDIQTVKGPEPGEQNGKADFNEEQPSAVPVK